MFSARVRAGLAGLVLMLCAGAASAQTPDPFSAAVIGQSLTLTWAPVPGATGYTIEAMPVGGAQFSAPVGNVTTFTLPGVPVGAYLARVRGTAGAVQGPPSQVVTVVVTGAPPAPPLAPVNLAAAVNGQNVLLSWNLPSTAGVSALGVQAGTTPGSADLGTFPIRISTSSYLPNVPIGTFYVRIFSFGAGGQSAASNELTLVTPGCSAPAAIPFSATSAGGSVQMQWGQVPGALGYRLDASSTPGGPANIGTIPFGPAQTSYSQFGIPTGTYYLTLNTTLSCGVSAKSAEQAVSVTAPIRLPAKGIGTATALVAEAGNAIGAQYPGELGASCGNNSWLFRVVQRLRSQDNRFGLNWKRGQVGDMSQDVITYNASEVPDDQANARHIYAWDVISGHCGGRPVPNAGNITNPNGAAGWTILPYLRAGLTP